MTGHRDKLARIISENPLAQQQADTVQQAMDLIENIRNLGAKPKNYELVSPFSVRVWVERAARSNSR